MCGKLRGVIFCLSPGGFVCSAQCAIWLQLNWGERSSPIASRGSPPFGSSKPSRNGEENSGLAKRSGMKRKSRMDGWHEAPSSHCWSLELVLGLFLVALTTTVATKAVDNPGQLAWRLPRVPGLYPLGPGCWEGLV